MGLLALYSSKRKFYGDEVAKSRLLVSPMVPYWQKRVQQWLGLVVVGGFGCFVDN